MACTYGHVPYYRSWISALYVSCAVFFCASFDVHASVEQPLRGYNGGAPLHFKMLHPLSMEAWTTIQERRRLVDPTFQANGHGDLPEWPMPGTLEYLHLLYHSSRVRVDHILGRDGKHGRGLVESQEPIDFPLPAPLQGLLYYAVVPIGTPIQELLLIVDTGSNLMWSNCNCSPTSCDTTSSYYEPDTSSTSRPVDCTSAFCTAEIQDDDSICTDQCNYIIRYLDGSSTRGTVFLDVLGGDASLPVLIGCGSFQTGNLLDTTNLPNSSFSYGGIMGLGQGPSILNTLADTNRIPSRALSLCLGGEDREGYLILGDATFPSGEGSGRTTMMSTHLYYVSLDAVLLGKDAVPGLESNADIYDPTSGGGVVLDTGAAITHMPSSIVTAIIAALLPYTTDLEEVTPPSTRNEGQIFPICFRGTIEDIKQKFPPLSFVFIADESGHPSTWAIPPENYLYEDDLSGRSRTCLGIIDDGPSSSLVILGQNFQKNFIFTFDLDRRTIAWSGTTALCDAKKRAQARPTPSPSQRTTALTPTPTPTPTSTSTPPPASKSSLLRPPYMPPLTTLAPSPPPANASSPADAPSLAAPQDFFIPSPFNNNSFFGSSGSPPMSTWHWVVQRSIICLLATLGVLVPL